MNETRKNSMYINNPYVTSVKKTLAKLVQAAIDTGDETKIKYAQDRYADINCNAITVEPCVVVDGRDVACFCVRERGFLMKDVEIEKVTFDEILADFGVKYETFPTTYDLIKDLFAKETTKVRLAKVEGYWAMIIKDESVDLDDMIDALDRIYFSEYILEFDGWNESDSISGSLNVLNGNMQSVPLRVYSSKEIHENILLNLGEGIVQDQNVPFEEPLTTLVRNVSVNYVVNDLVKTLNSVDVGISFSIAQNPGFEESDFVMVPVEGSDTHFDIKTAKDPDAIGNNGTMDVTLGLTDKNRLHGTVTAQLNITARIVKAEKEPDPVPEEPVTEPDPADEEEPKEE